MLLFDNPKDCPFCKPKPENVLVSYGGVFLMKATTPDGTVVPNRYQIVPFRHTGSLAAMPDGKTKELLVQHIPEVAEGGYDYNLSTNVGEDAGQRVFHIHEWVIVRDDNLRVGMSGLIERLVPKEPVYHEPGEQQY